MTEPGKKPETQPPGPGMPKQYPESAVGANAAAAIFLAVIIVFMLNYLADRHYKRLDWTAEKYYTLSPKTANILEALKSPVQVTVFISTASELYGDIKELLSGFESHTQMLDVEYVDPDINYARFELIQKKHKIRNGVLPDGREVAEQFIIISSGERVQFVTPEDITDYEFDADPYGSAPSLKSFKAEQELTSAILSVTEAESLKICFLTGHGEWSVDRHDERGIGHIESLLRRDNYGTEALSLSDKKKIPASCRLVVIAGPERPYTETEANKIEQYFTGGGNLLVFIDPIVDGTRFVDTGLEKVLAGAGIDARKAIIVESDESRLLPVSGVGMETFVTADYGDHDIVVPLAGLASLFRIVTPLSRSGKGDASPVPLVRTSGQSWGETDLEDAASSEEPQKEDSDIAGPLTLAFASILPGFKQAPEDPDPSVNTEKKEEAKGRLVVFGDSDMLQADLFEQLTFCNLELVLGSIAWLTKRPSLISIAAKNPENVKLNFTNTQMRMISLWILLVLPLLAVIAGIVIWLRRRR
ncbi:MAG: GldG family protein [Pseudomonadota bacterium]